ncbi:hypothetical protein [Chitinophaga sancti]|uniref:Alpha/beta hydrolase family protein n=1 Tax=Chitinophaga sancti TaxID=1004 RepID=A0ABZ0XM98_9BACT|nr:hypothetical protein [Chitinophaga sancti]WQD62624.1 hypothetical protein U0033_32535 [Chitinophaga sancti]WQG91806.1 hypothetical protein SR876_09850 [Chitinophaga sancti]
MESKLTMPLAWSVLYVSAYSQSKKNLRYFGQGNAVLPNSVPYGNNHIAGHYIQAGDAKIYYEVYGKEQPVALLHGGVFGSAYDLTRLATFYNTMTASKELFNSI